MRVPNGPRPRSCRTDLRVHRKRKRKKRILRSLSKDQFGRGVSEILGAYRSVPIARTFDVDFGLGMERPLRRFSTAREFAMVSNDAEHDT